MPDGQVRAADSRGQPGPAGQFAGAAEPGDVADLGEHDQRGELADAGQRGQHLDPRVCLGVLAHLGVEPVDLRREPVEERQAVGDDLPGHRGQVQLGQPAAPWAGSEELHLISAPASRDIFAGLVLDQLDPASCLKHLKAIVSPHPYDLEPVEPVIEFAQAKYRYAEPVDALAGIDSRPDLLKIDWYKFENLIRQLFEAMGLEVHVTQSSRDEGIDAVAYNKTDIVHQAEILIQAKRYSRCVPANDVRALAGSVEEKRATTGVLVTTAWVGPETKAFAARNNRLRIIEGGELKHLLAEHLDLDVRIDLGRPPRRKP